MKFVRQILLNPVGIALAIVHWIVAAYAMLGDVPEYVIPIPGGYAQVTYLSQYLIVIDLPAILIANAVSGALFFISGFDSSYIRSAFAIVFVTIQWQIVGTLCSLALNNFGNRNDVFGISSK